MATSFIDAIKRCFTGAGVLKWLITINLAVFLIVGIINVSTRLMGIDLAWAHEWLSLPSDLNMLALHPWTLITYMFTQYDFLHILFNLLWLYWFGQVLLQTLSARHLLWLYIVGGIVGGALFIAIYNLLPAFSAYRAELSGASASVLAIVTAAAFRSPDYSLNFFLIGEIRLKWIAVFVALLSLIGIGGSNAGGEVAHLGGIAVGVCFGLSLRRGRDLAKLPYWVANMFSQSPRSKMNVAKVTKAMNHHRSEMQRLDELLDKIHVSGYGALTRKERAELEELSKRLQK